jgi:Reverse transcriptase (RNA-dependent DNA polymerase)
MIVETTSIKDGYTDLSLNIVTYNIHGFKQNWSYLQDRTQFNDIIFVQEHWLLSDELNLLGNINNDFVVFAKSSMNAKCEKGLLKGRPFGGVAVLVRRKFSREVNFSGSDNDGRIICVKICNGSVNLLLVGCYFPCNDNSTNYADSLSQVLGYIESLVVCNPGCRICILGDLNFECSLSSQGFSLFSDLANEYSLVSCDDLINDNVNYTYHHKTLNQRSCIDHVFIVDDFKGQIGNFRILREPLNLSDHFPIVFSLTLPGGQSTMGNKLAKNKTTVREYRWDKGDLNDYYSRTRDLLGRIDHDFQCKSSELGCSNADHHIDIEVYYSEIVHALTVAAAGSIPRVAKSALKHYWSAALDDLKMNSKSLFDLWAACGKPHSGSVYNLMKDAKYKYKLAVRHVIREYEDKFSDELYEHFLSKDMCSFWKTWSAKTSKKILKVTKIDDCLNDNDIAEAFCSKFESQADDIQAFSDDSNRGCNDFDDDIGQWLVTVEDVESVISNMKLGKAAGIDNLTLEHIIHAHPSIVSHLRNLFNLILKHGYVPNLFGRGIVIPLIKDKHGDVTKSDNYRGITISPVISKIFEGCLLLKFQPFLYSSDLQLGFKKDIGCGPALFMFQQTVKYFRSLNSTVFVTAVDASKAFDRINHFTLLQKLRERALPACFIRVISCWYEKLYSVVRWHCVYSREFKVCAGVRQGGILSPILFNVYVDNLIEQLSNSGYGCHIGKSFMGCIMYADDLLLMSPSIIGMQHLLDICTVYGKLHNIIFNALKTVIFAVGNHNMFRPSMFIAEQIVSWVEGCKYLGVSFIARSHLLVDVAPIKRKFYAALNSVFSRSSTLHEPVKLQLVHSFCLPLLVYCVGALELSVSSLRELGVCWNDAFRKIFGYNRWESVKVLQFFCGCLDFVHIYDLFRLKFLSQVVKKLPFISSSYASLELKFHTLENLIKFYGAYNCSFSVAVYEHFYSSQLHVI